jgi:hypothetical protein
MAAVAGAAGVSEPTVMRFCTGLGFDGFQSFKYALAEALAIGIPVTHSAIRLDDPVQAVAAKIFDHTLSSLDRTRRSLDADAVATAVDLLLQARDVLFVGLGASGIIAQDALQQAVLFGVPCAAPVDLHQQFMSASMCRPGSVLVAISNTGRTTSILDIAAQGSGAERRSSASPAARDPCSTWPTSVSCCGRSRTPTSTRRRSAASPDWYSSTFSRPRSPYAGARSIWSGWGRMKGGPVVVRAAAAGDCMTPPRRRARHRRRHERGQGGVCTLDGGCTPPPAGRSALQQPSAGRAEQDLDDL